MATQTLRGQRVAAQANEVIDRSRTISFSFNGRSYPAHPGDTIASALVAAGVKVVSRSFKYHRPRGLMAYGHDINSMVQIGDEVSVSMWLRLVEDGMVVKSVNTWPSVDRDLMSLSRFGDRLLPVGFYYKTFIRPQFMWPTYEKVLRQAAGLGKLNTESTHVGGYYKQYLHGDVAIVGGGPAGMAAAVAAAEAGARVLLFDDNDDLGGHLRYSSSGGEQLAELKTAVAHQPTLQVYTATTVNGRYDHNFLAAVSGKVLYKIRAKRVIFATGAVEQPLVFANNDLPGIMMGSTVSRLLHLYATVLGQRVAIVTANDDGWQLAADLRAAGVQIAGVVDQRSAGGTIADEMTHLGVPTFWRHTIIKANGGKTVTGIQIAPVDAASNVNEQAATRLDCDLIAVSVAWAPDNSLLYQSGCKIAYDHNRHEFLAQEFSDTIHAAGRVLGSHDLENEIDDGRFAGQTAAAALGRGSAPSPQARGGLTRCKNEEPVRTSDLVLVNSKGKKFVDFDEDVTLKDLETAVAEGYNSIELLKRYSTISMGPSQGKWSSINTIHLAARANNWSIEETGTTTSRPPFRPTELAVLAGQIMEPVKYSTVHDWHLAHGAEMMVSGLWLRPHHYGDPVAEVKAVRERVGLIDISTLGKLRLTGPGVPNLLDKIYINRWQKLRVGRVRYGVMCNDEGIVLDDGVTAHIGEDEWYTTVTSSGAGTMYEWIQWWVQSGWGDGVHVTNVTEDNAAFNLAGPESRKLLAELTDADLSNEAMPYMSVRDVILAGVPCRLLRIGFTGELSYEIHCPTAYGGHVWEAIMEAGQKFGIKPFGVEAQRILRLEKAHIIIGQDTDALSDPISAGMAWAVKLDKQDFLGKRPLARLSEVGVKQRLVGFKMVDHTIVPEEGVQIVTEGADEKLTIIGWVTSSRLSPTLNEVIGLCWLPVEMAKNEGTEFTIYIDGKLIPARVHHGAFYDPLGEKLWN